MSNVPGLFVLGEANFSDHGANRLGASALMQGLADGYFVIPYTVANYLSGLLGSTPLSVDDPAFAEAQQSVDDRMKRLLSIGGTRSVDHYHRELGKLMWDYCGMARNRTGLEKALSEIPALRDEFWRDVRVLGDGPMNQSLERAGRVADFFELGELMVRDALDREESCGGHFREESQTDEGEALRRDDQYAYVAAWEWAGEGGAPALHREPLTFDEVHLTQRSYK
jgi:succinate dehydrogenase / fumarate reductase flavoprotein subunit